MMDFERTFNKCTKKTYCSTLEVYNEIPIFISVDTAEDVVESVMHKILRIWCAGSMESEDIHRWLLNFGEDIKKLRISVQIFVEWIANHIPPWTAYRVLISDRLITLDKLPGVSLVGVGEIWQHIFAKCVLRVTGPEATNMC